MKTITQMQDKLAELLNNDAVIRHNAVNQNNRELTGSEKDNITNIYNEIEILEKDIERELRAEKVRARLEGTGVEPNKPDPADGPDARSAAALDKESRGHRMNSTHLANSIRP